MVCENANFGFCSNSDDCFDGEKSTATCWTFILLQSILSFTVLVILPIFTATRNKINERRADAKHDHAAIAATALHTAFARGLSSPDAGRHFRNCSISKTIRSEENFMKSNFDPNIQFPSDYLPEYTPAHSMNIFQFVKVLCKFIITTPDVRCIIRRSFGLALMSSSMSSIIAIILKYEVYYGEDLCNYWNVKDSLLGYAISFRATIDSFKFLPIFLLLAYVGFVVDRWRLFLKLGHVIQGCIQGTGLLVGSKVPVPVPESTKKRLYKIYRYLNMIHILCYASFIPSWDASRDGVADYGMKLGLLTYEEGTYVLSTDNKPRDGLFGLLTYEIRLLLEEKNNHNPVLINQQIINWRATMAELHDMFISVHPNEYIIVMHTLAGAFSMLIIFGYSILLFNTKATTSISSCFQPMVLIGVFCILASLYFPVVLFRRLMNPFTENGRGIEVIQLIAASEKTLFQSLRSLFHIDEKGNIIPLNESADDFIDDDDYIDNELTDTSAVDTNVRRGRTRGSLLRSYNEKEMIRCKGGYGEL